MTDKDYALALQELSEANTRLQRAEAELRRSERALRLLLSQFPGAVWTTDGNLKITSLAGAQDLGMVAGDIVPDDAIAAHELALDSEESVYETTRGERTYEVTVEPQPEGAGVIAVALDVTERRRAEAERLTRRLVQAQKLEMLGLLAGGIAHDFNNLLATILGNASLALLKLPADAKGRECIERIEASATRAGELTRQMLAYSGRGHFVIEPVDIAGVVEDMAHLLRVSIPKKVLLRMDFTAVPPIEADLAQLRQLILNLITNAADAIGEAEGVVTLSTETVDADEEYLSSTWIEDDLVPGLYVIFEVTDDGCGMDAGTMRRMFDPFFTTKDGGHGLGLAATLGIVRGHRGAIHVQSMPAQGTRIRVMFPASQRPIGARPTVSSATNDVAGGRLLVADDEQAVRELLHDALTDAGFTVDLAENGQEALERYDGHDLVLLDVTMPVMDGAEALEELRKRDPDVLVLLSSGYQDAEQGIPRPAAGFIQKPYRIEELVRQIRDLL